MLTKTNHHHRRKATARNERGNALTEGSAALVVVIPVCIGAIFLLLGTATAWFFKIKLAYVATSAASAGVQQRYWLGSERFGYTQNIRPVVETGVNELVTNMTKTYGLTLGGSATTDLNLSSPDFCDVQVTAIDLPMLKGSFLPSVLNLTDSASEPYVKRAPIGMYGLTFNTVGVPGSGRGMYFPSYGAGRGTPGPHSLPSTNFPFYTSLAEGNASGARIGGPSMAGDYQNYDGGPAFSHY